MSALSTIGGGTSSKGHGNDNELVIGSDVTKGVNTGDRQDIETGDVNGDVNGDVTAGDKKETTTANNTGNVTVGDKNEYNADVISLGLNWWQALIVAIIAGLLIPSPLSLLRRRK
jgi:hypothetical protein